MPQTRLQERQPPTARTPQTSLPNHHTIRHPHRCARPKSRHGAAHQAVAKFKTPIMLKIRVNPLESMNSNKPVTSPFSSENVTSSSMLVECPRHFVPSVIAKIDGTPSCSWEVGGGVGIDCITIDRTISFLLRLLQSASKAPAKLHQGKDGINTANGLARPLQSPHPPAMQ